MNVNWRKFGLEWSFPREVGESNFRIRNGQGFDNDVWQRLGWSRLSGRGLIGNQIGEIKTAIGQHRDLGLGLLNRDFLKGPGTAKNRRELEVYIQFIPAREEIAIGFFQGQAANGQ